MKFSASILVLLPLLASSALAFPAQSKNAQAAAAAKAPANKAVAAGGKGASSSAPAKSAVTSSVAASSAAASSAAASSAAASAAAPSAASSTASAADLQTSLTLDPSQVQPGLAQNGQAVQEAGQVASLTSVNNFINFCATLPNLPLTNGQQVKTGSCNPTIMGVIISQDVMPSCKFVFPVNMQTIEENTPFTVQLAINNLETGNFVNAQQNYFAAPAQINGQGQLIGHSHVVIESLPSITSTTPNDPTIFAFFKGLNAPAVNGILTADVTGGLPAGAYKISTINSAANHQPVLVSVAQHAALDDAVYFTVTPSGAASSSAAAAPLASSASAAAAPPAASASAAAAKTAIVKATSSVAAKATTSAKAAASAPAAKGKTTAAKGKAGRA